VARAFLQGASQAHHHDVDAAGREAHVVPDRQRQPALEGAHLHDLVLLDVVVQGEKTDHR
jgi:hypothetical protein